jgi:hypothetical protein
VNDVDWLVSLELSTNLNETTIVKSISAFKTSLNSTLLIHLPLTIPMASRRLALNLTQGLRGRAGLNAVAPLRRGFATPVVKNGVKTQSTTLSNGLTVRLGFGSIALVAY